jgi:serine protease Do
MQLLNISRLPWLMAAITATSFLLPSPPSFAQTNPRGLPDFTELVEQVGPSVVNIKVFEKASQSKNSRGFSDPQMQDFLRRFFGEDFAPNPRSPNRPGPKNSEEKINSGQGSGFIISSDGLVMTNAHVVEGADEVLVTLTDKRELKAKVLGADKASDIAVLRVEAKNLPSVKIGDINRLKVGEWVMAIGSPFGLENSVTAGIVSAKQRDTGDFLPHIQTDVAINPGNSGGPLINMRGEVVGVNSQIYSRSGGYMGISFSIPIDEAIRVSEQLKNGGKVVRGGIGVEIESISKEMAETLGLKSENGALIRGIKEGSAAASAGLKVGDVITHFDGKPIISSKDLPSIVRAIKPGSKTNISIIRQKTAKTLPITVGTLQLGDKAQEADKKPETESKNSSWGLKLSDLTTAQLKSLKISGGVKIDQATEQAARAGLKAGDIITGLNQIEINNLKEFQLISAKLDKNKPVYVQFLRDEWTRYTLIKP